MSGGSKNKINNPADVIVTSLGLSELGLRLKTFKIKPALQTGGVRFERNGVLEHSGALMKYAIQLHYGN